MQKIVLILIVSFLPFLLSAQKVGLVLSGGGSSGVAHIGVLKALEENGIPIDYIAGTSMGALIGGFYAAGYSPKEIEQIFLSDGFKDWTDGILDDKYVYYLRKKNEDASIITLKIATDTTLQTTLPTNLVSPAAINYGLMEYFAPSSAKSVYNFDSLFVPFRCVAADIISKKEVVFKNGGLAIAIRASMAYPFYLTPISYKDMLLFDGGLYNNFPADVMYNDFFPDYIIGSNVSSNFLPPDEEDVISQLKSLIVYNTEYSIPCEEGLLIQPEADNYSTFNFNNNKELIEIGYQAALKSMDSLLLRITRRRDTTELKERRKKYRKELPPLIFENIEVLGLTDGQNKYIEKALGYRKDTVSAKELKAEYIKISSDDKIKSVYPQAVYNPVTGRFNLNLKAKKEKDLFVSFGGLFSSRPINQAFVGLRYNVLGRTALTLTTSSYFGKLYNSINGGVRLDFPFRLPFYWETIYTLEKWDYFKSQTTFFEDTKPSFLVIGDAYLRSELGFPVAYKGKITFGGTYGKLDNRYYQTDQFISTDTTDETTFQNVSGVVQFERNSLNKKQYATKGNYLSFRIRYIQGEENTIPGSTSIIKDKFNTTLEWFDVKLTLDRYFNKRSKVNFGILAEGVYTNQPFFNNYTATILAAPAFQPLSESITLFQERFRAHTYIAGGLKTIYSVSKSIQFRLEGYFFQPYQEILQDVDDTPFYGPEWSKRHVIGSFSTVYYTPIGPIALNLNYYDKTDEPWSFLFHFGYIIFNKKSLD